jgi:hypothetical protein
LTLSRQIDDPDRAILHLTEAILHCCPSAKVRRIIPWCPFVLAWALFNRFECTRQPEGLQYSIEYFRHLRNSDLPLETLHVVPNDIIIGLVSALGAHLELEARNAMQNIGEMVTLCRELLASDDSGDDLANSLVILSRAAFPTLKIRLGKALDQVIECMREAIEMCPPGFGGPPLCSLRTISVHRKFSCYSLIRRHYR